MSSDKFDPVTMKTTELRVRVASLQAQAIQKDLMITGLEKRLVETDKELKTKRDEILKLSVQIAIKNDGKKRLMAIFVALFVTLSNITLNYANSLFTSVPPDSHANIVYAVGWGISFICSLATIFILGGN